MNQTVVEWLLSSDEPWTRYRTLVDLQHLDRGRASVQAARTEMVQHPKVQELIAAASSWPGYGIKRHNDAKHPLHSISMLADFGLKISDKGMHSLVAAIMANQDPAGPFQTYSYLYKRFAGIQGEYWTWMMCDAPTLLFALLRFGLASDPRVQKAIDHMLDLVRRNGWPCAAGSPMRPDFKGPGKREDPCPYANLIALKVLAQLDGEGLVDEAKAAAEVLLKHWDRAYDHKLYMFGTGSKYRKLKYPFVWYDILHTAEVLSQFPFVFNDHRFRAMLQAIARQANDRGYFTASSMYRAWRGWSFADKKEPSPWLTLVAVRVLQRAGLEDWLPQAIG